MLNQFIHFVMSQATYEKDENGVIIAKVEGYQGFFSCGDNFEEARENLLDAIEGVIYIKLKLGDKVLIQQIEEFNEKRFKKESDLVFA